MKTKKLTPKKVVKAFFNENQDTHIWVDKLRNALGMTACNSVIDQIEKRVDKEVAERKAVKTTCNIGDDGAGLDHLLDVRIKANNEGKVHYHFDNAILRHLPNYKGDRIEIVA